MNDVGIGETSGVTPRDDDPRADTVRWSLDRVGLAGDRFSGSNDDDRARDEADLGKVAQAVIRRKRYQMLESKSPVDSALLLGAGGDLAESRDGGKSEGAGDETCSRFRMDLCLSTQPSPSTALILEEGTVPLREAGAAAPAADASLRRAACWISSSIGQH